MEKIEQKFYTGCLPKSAYYIDQMERQAVIDPLREVQPLY